MRKITIQVLTLLILLLGTTSCVRAAEPVIYFSDINSGPKNGNTDGFGSGAIVTIWGVFLGANQSNSKIYVGDAEVTDIYYWKNADGNLPGGPADLYTYHKMQEIAFAIPANAPDGLTTIKVVVNGVSTNTIPFTVRPGNIKFIKSDGDDSNGDGSWNSPYKTLQSVFDGNNGKVSPGDIVYTVGVGSTSGLSVGRYAAIKGTNTNPVSLLAYPNTQVLISGAGYDGSVIYNYYGSNPERSSEYINFSKLSVVASGGNAENGVKTFKGNRMVGLEITGPTVYGGYGGAITGSGGGNGAGSGEQAGGGKYFGIYIHNYGYQSTTPGLNNYGWAYEQNSDTWTSPPYDGVADQCTNCTSVDRFQHLYYISNRSPDAIDGYEIGWNYLVDNPILHGIHIYDMSPDIGGWNTPISIHDNVVKNQRGSSIDASYPNADTGINAGTAAPVYIYNNIIINEEGNINPGRAIDVGGDPSAKVYNNTIYGFRYINRIATNGTSDFQNNIIVENQTPIDFSYYVYGTPTIKRNNLFYSPVSNFPVPSWFSQEYDLNEDPLFADVSSEDFSLSADSPAINSGSDDVLTLSPTDFFGQTRVAGSVDMGAIEYVDNSSDLFRADVDNNSQINTTDAMLTLRNSLGLDMSGTNWQTSTTTGDVNCDNTTNSTDAMLILRYSLGLSMSETEWCVE